jgi:hypothetical protein
MILIDPTGLQSLIVQDGFGFFTKSNNEMHPREQTQTETRRH